MKYSQLFGKTKKQVSSTEESTNAQLLIKGGFIQKEIAGVYAFLPLGLIVFKKIENIIREEMNAIGGQELFLGSLQNPEIWKTTNRWDDEVYDVWFKSKLHAGGEIGFASTHEEPLTTLMKQQIQSYKDLPLYVYQFQNKFRNELRSKSGLLRTREFIMKDLYSFDKNEADLDAFYEKVKAAYTKIFNRIGIGAYTYLTFASGGTFSKFSHEFQTICEVGEDTIYVSKEKGIAINKEVYTDEVLAELNLNKNELQEMSAVEVGNIFKLKNKYSKALDLKFTDETGKEQEVVMGSYGIGVSRNMATAVEIHHDDKGIIWPKSISPFTAHIVSLNKEKAEKLYNKLLEKNVEVLIDDREDVHAGGKFADADLIGCPYRVIVSNKTEEKYEVKARNSEEIKMLNFQELVTLLNS